MTPVKSWIMDPRGHRRLENAHMADAPATVEWLGQEVNLITQPAKHEEWICDYCNATIGIGSIEDPQPVPLAGSYALCARCFVKEGGLRAWRHPGGRMLHCGCSACMIRSEQVYPEEKGA